MLQVLLQVQGEGASSRLLQRLLPQALVAGACLALRQALGGRPQL